VVLVFCESGLFQFNFTQAAVPSGDSGARVQRAV
jgi:hypothetical protein